MFYYLYIYIYNLNILIIIQNNAIKAIFKLFQIDEEKYYR